MTGVKVNIGKENWQLILNEFNKLSQQVGTGGGGSGGGNTGGGLMSFNTLADLQAAYPNGIDQPVWVQSTKSFYYWSDTTAPPAPTFTGLKMNGSSSDYLVSPSVTVDKVIMDMNIDPTQNTGSFYYYFDFRYDTSIVSGPNYHWAYGHISNVPNSGWGGSAAELTKTIVNGTTAANAAAFDVPRGVDVSLEMDTTIKITGPILFFRKNNDTLWMKATIYRLRGYNGATLVFDYDMTKGNVQDQSGNNNHGTLYGGTWA